MGIAVEFRFNSDTAALEYLHIVPRGLSSLLRPCTSYAAEFRNAVWLIKMTKHQIRNILLAFLVMVAGFVVLAESSGAQSSADVSAFDQRDFSRDELRFIQAALASNGFYEGLFDGQWGAISNGSFEQLAVDLNVRADQGLAIVAAAVFAEDVASLKFRPYQHLPGSISWMHPEFLGLPLSRSVQELYDGILEASSDEDFSVEVVVGNYHQITAIHDKLERLDYTNNPYTYLGRTRKVSSAYNSSGVRQYFISHALGQNYVGIMVTAGRSAYEIMALIVGSMGFGDENKFQVPKSGLIADFIRFNNDDAADTAPSGYFGSGFVINENHDVLTNWHVVEGCTEFYVDQVDYNLLDFDEVLDVAILRSSRGRLKGREYALFTLASLKLNQSVIVAGFPLPDDIGSGLTITRGGISRIDSDNDLLQVSAPVNPGNSGGPVLLQDGTIVGQINSRVTKIGETDVLGVSFGTTSTAIRSLLKYLDVEHIVPVQKPVILTDVQLGELAKKITVQITCYNG